MVWKSLQEDDTVGVYGGSMLSTVTGKVVALGLAFAILAPAGCSKVEVQQVSLVSVMFKGLMIGCKPNNGHHQFGIVNDSDHKFTVDDKPHPNSGRSWSLYVVKDGVPVNRAENLLNNESITNKSSDTAGNKNSFGWTIDFETPDWHGYTPLQVDKRQLSHVISIKAGDIDVWEKSPQLVRKRGCPSDKSFCDCKEQADTYGFVAETIKVSIQLKAGESCVLHDDEKKNNIVDIPCDGSNHEVIIANVSHDNSSEDKPSHFRLYYRVITVPEALQCEIGIAKEWEKHKPINLITLPNPLPPLGCSKTGEIGIRSCCGMDCAPVFLGKTQDSL